MDWNHQTMLDELSSYLTSPVVWSPITTANSSDRARFASDTIEGTFMLMLGGKWSKSLLMGYT